MKLLNIVGTCTACEVSLRGVIKPFLDRYEFEELVITQELVDKYGIEKTPALILLDGEKMLGVLYGYQPEFILEQWLIAKERSK